jgi:heavy metal sensor kinase
LFSAIFFALSCIVFLLAFRFLVQQQYDHLVDTLALFGNTIKEEFQEESFQEEDSEDGEIRAKPDLLHDLSTDSNLSVYLYNREGTLVGSTVNFSLPNRLLQTGKHAPELIVYDQTMLLRASSTLSDHGTDLGLLILVYRMSSETGFLKLLGFLLLGANLLGALIALLASLAASRRMLAPIGQMITAANQIDRATLDERLAVPEPDDELKSLALTLNRMLDRVSAAYHQQGRFVADVSHELRTPLAIMQGNVDLLSRWGMEDKAVREDSIDALAKQTAYMNRLVENLLFLARSDNAKFLLEKTTFSVGALFSELLEEQSLIDTAHTYAQSISPEGATLCADRAMIKQALRALIDNSVKYTPTGGTITLGFAREAGANSLSVRDDGAGMASEDCAHIFERFYRVDRARSKATGGMGLGLSIVLAIAQSHGGSARAESAPGTGTRVTITLPEQSV